MTDPPNERSDPAPTGKASIATHIDYLYVARSLIIEASKMKEAAVALASDRDFSDTELSALELSAAFEDVANEALKMSGRAKRAREEAERIALVPPTDDTKNL